MSQQPATERQNAKPPARWDFSDMVIGGKDGRSVVLKHQHEACDLMNHPEIQKTIYDMCVAKAYETGETVSSGGHIFGDPKNKDFAIEYDDYDLKCRVRFRVSVQQSIEGVYFCIRRINGDIPTLEEQGHHPNTIMKLLNAERRGLVLIGGEMGSGKTTTASAAIREWLGQNGGTAITLEDPPEYRLQGMHGGNGVAGFCLQRAIHAEQMAKEIPGLMRAAAPNIIFLGEIRNSATAREVMLAASNGHLVISTIHGKGVEGVLHRLISLSTGDGMTIENIAKIMADAISLVVHQELVRKGNIKMLKTQIMDMDNESTRVAMKMNISENKIDKVAQTFHKPIESKSLM